MNSYPKCLCLPLFFYCRIVERLFGFYIQSNQTKSQEFNYVEGLQKNKEKCKQIAKEIN